MRKIQDSEYQGEPEVVVYLTDLTREEAIQKVRVVDGEGNTLYLRED